MNTIIKLLFATILSFVAFAANAQGYVPTIECGSYRSARDECNLPGATAYNQQGHPIGRFGNRGQAVQLIPVVYSTMPVGITNGSGSFCQHVVEQVGRTVGADRYNDIRHAEIGGLIGLISGNVFCPGNRSVAVREEVVVRGERVVSGGERTMIKPSICETGDEKITGLTREECMSRGTNTTKNALCGADEKLQANAETNQIACSNKSTGERRLLSVSEVCSQGERLQHNPSTRQVACFNPETGKRRFL